MGTEKQKESSRKQWAQLSPEQRKKRMEPLIKARWSKISKLKRQEHAKKMAAARWKNK